jgi:hypothetical protein
MDELDKRCVPETAGDDREAIMSAFQWEAMRMIAEVDAADGESVESLTYACAAEGIEWKPVGMKVFLKKWWGGA